MKDDLMAEEKIPKFLQDAWTLNLRNAIPCDNEEQDEDFVISDPSLCKCGKLADCIIQGKEAFQWFCNECLYGPEYKKQEFKMEFGSSMKVRFITSKKGSIDD